MKNLLKHAILAGVATLALGSITLANSYTDIQNPNATVGPSLGDYFAGAFNLVNPGSSSYIIGAPYTSGTGTFTDAEGHILNIPLSGATDSFYIYGAANGLYGVGPGANTLQYAMLQADTTASSGIPNGGTTLALLGIGLLGICAVSRKIRS
jgi:hypothetical protein